MPRRRGKKDIVHDECVQAFEAVGCSVAELIDTGIPGFPDLVVGCMGVNHLVECKTPETAYGRAGLNTNQTTFDRDWRGEKVWIATGRDSCLALVQNWRRACR